MLQQAEDFREEGRALYRLLETLSADDWQRPTLFKGWTVNDVIQHIHAGDLNAMLSATDPAGFMALRADIEAQRASGLSRVEETRRRLDNLEGRALLTRWMESLEELCGVLGAMDPAARLKWVARDMGVRMFTTARQMETWAHGQAIYDLMGMDREASDRIKNIAVIGVRTFGWTFANRDLPVPPNVPYVRLRAPSGAVWEWHEPSNESVEGDAVEFCQVVTQTRNVGDTSLSVAGETAQRWMAIAQCFAGPPEDPLPPGARHKAILD